MSTFTLQRELLYSHDIQRVFGCSLRQAQRKLKDMRELSGKVRRNWITVDEFVRYSGVPRRIVERQLTR